MHIRFEDPDEDRKTSHAQASTSWQAAAAAAGFAGALGGVAGFRCLHQLRTDFDQQDQCYVFELVPNTQLNLVAARLSNRRIKLFTLSNTTLEFVGELAGHAGAISDARFDLLDTEPHLLHSCDRGGSVLGWDVRSGQAVERFSAPRVELLSVSTNGTMVAAGAGDRVLFWDRRTQRPLTSFDDTHAQEVTAVRFHPVHRGMLVSASEDGLVAVFDTSKGPDEDEGFKAAINIDTSPARLGFYGPQGSKLWVTSGTETLHLWEWAAACDDQATGGTGPLATALDARQQLTASAAGVPGGAALAPEIDYLIGCEYSAAQDQLWLLAGTCAGAVGFFPVAEPAGSMVASSTGLFGPPLAALPAGAHTDVVRSVLWPGAGGGLVLSGGEDSRVCTWSLNLQGATAAGMPGATASTASAARPAGSTSSSDSAVRRQREHVRRNMPY